MRKLFSLISDKSKLGDTERMVQRALFPILLLTSISLPFAIEVGLAAHRITVPLELLLALASISIGVATLKSYKKLWTSIDRPLFLICLSLVLWLVVTSLTSVRPGISLKSTLVEVVHWWVFYIGIFLIFMTRNRKGVFQLLSALSISMGIVVIYTWFHHSMHGFRPNTAQIAALPFLKDHTLYGACFAMMVPWNIWLAFYWRHRNRTLFQGYIIFTIVLLIAVFLSFSRVAWIGLIGASIILSLFSQKWKLAIMGLVILGGLLLMLANSGDYRSTRADGILPFMAGMSSFDKDVSVRERLNRYKSAIRMSQVRPWFGFGPGTYQFEYHTYQKKEEMTRISSTEPVHDISGRGGSTHSEYLKALAETGFPGMIIWIAILAFGLLRSRSSRNEHAEHKTLMLACRTSLLIYLVISIFNNFIHEGIMAFFFWLPLALITLLQPVTHEGRAAG